MNRWLSHTRVIASNRDWRSGAYCAWRSSSGTVTNKLWYTPRRCFRNRRRTVEMARIYPLIWIAYLLLPSEGGILTGLPLDRIDTVALLLVLWAAAHRVRFPGS